MTSCGIGFRQPIREDILSNRESLDCIEIISDQFLNSASWPILEALAEDFMVIPHGVKMSIGSASRPDPNYLANIKGICRTIEAEFYGEHLSLNSSPGIEVGHLAPVIGFEPALPYLVRNISEIQEHLNIPLCIENITYDIDLGSGGLQQAQVLREVVQRTGCSLLLDVTNLYTNSVNHQVDVEAFLAELPMNRVRQVHLAGGKAGKSKLIDSHDQPVPKEVWTILREISSDINPDVLIVERDDNFPDFDELLGEVAAARQILHGKP